MIWGFTDTTETRVWLLPWLRMKWNSIRSLVSRSPSPGTPFLCYSGCKPGRLRCCPGFGHRPANVRQEAAGVIWWCPLGRLALTSASYLHVTGCEELSWFVEAAKLTLSDPVLLWNPWITMATREKWWGFGRGCKTASLFFALQICSWRTEFIRKLN